MESPTLQVHFSALVIEPVYRYAGRPAAEATKLASCHTDYGRCDLPFASVKMPTQPVHL